MKKLLLVLCVLFISSINAFSQLRPWQQTPIGSYWMNYWDIGMVAINQVPAPVGTPTLMIHSFSPIAPEYGTYPASVLLQTEKGGEIPDLFGENYIEFWSNKYYSPYKWQTGRIMTYTNESTTFTDLSTNMRGGLKFACSGGPSFAEAANGPVDVLYLYNKNVGIGQSDPQEKLHVGGWVRSDSLVGLGNRIVYANAQGRLITTGSPIGAPCITPWCTMGNDIIPGQFLGSLGDSPLVFKTQGLEVMRLNTTDWQNQAETVMELSMNSWHDYPKITMGYYNDKIPCLRLFAQTGVSCPEDMAQVFSWQIENYVGSDELWETHGALHFSTPNEEWATCENTPVTYSTKMSILRNGKVGIGTIYPKQTLHVAGKAIIGTLGVSTGIYAEPELAVDGTIVAKEIVVTDGDEWGDFVFKENYPLINIEDLEKKIKELGHLPGIPSAEEVNTNGVNIRDMQNKLLQKIEEISLYLIELKKENKQLNEKVVELEKKIGSGE